MKLYTEEQVKQSYLEGWNDGREDSVGYIDRTVDSLNPIQLPSDEEIENECLSTYREHPSNPKEHPEWNYGKDINAPRKRKAFYKGAKWMKEIILNQSK